MREPRARSDITTAKERAWTEAEDAVLREVYPRGIQAAMAALPQRSRRGIYARAMHLRIRSRRGWTADDTKRLHDFWQTVSLPRLAEMLGRTPMALMQRAWDLGLPVRPESGYEGVAEASKRTGVPANELRRILRSLVYRERWQPPTYREFRGIRPRAHLYQPHQIDAAVERWLATETLYGAASARGVSRPTMRAALEAAGVKPVLLGRYASADVDRALAAYGGRVAPPRRWRRAA